jgi:hypothetical protein
MKIFRHDCCPHSPPSHSIQPFRSRWRFLTNIRFSCSFLATSRLHIVVVRVRVDYVCRSFLIPGRSNPAEQVPVESPDKRTFSFSRLLLASCAIFLIRFLLFLCVDATLSTIYSSRLTPSGLRVSMKP